MRMKFISKCIFSVFWVLTLFSIQAQEANDTISSKTDRYGLRVGADVVKLTRSFIEKNYRGIEFTGDYRLTRNYYLAGELGNENRTVNEDRVNYTTKGSYLKVGFDYNVYENWLDMENLIYVGMRYAVSTFDQTLNSYKIYAPQDPYFTETPEVISGEKFKSLSAQWVEVVVGMKAEVFNNVYAGFSIRINRMLVNKEPSGFENLYVPGFNRTYSSDFGMGFNYSITYFIPIYKKKITSKKTTSP